MVGKKDSLASARLSFYPDEVVYIINFVEIAYHQGKALYIIIAKEIYSLTADEIHATRDDIQPDG